MSGFAGTAVTSGLIPGHRVFYSDLLADSATFTTTETTLMVGTGSNMLPGMYRLHVDASYMSTVAGDRMTARIRELSTSGNIIQSRNIINVVTATTLGYPCTMTADYHVTSILTRQFVVTGRRIVGTGTCRIEAGTTRPALFYMEYVGPAV